jgi:hypothetical protein
MTELCRRGTATAQNPEEAKVLFNLAKSASFGGDSHSWHSVDGRELGPPSKKIFDLRCNAECSLLNIGKSHHQKDLEHCMRAILQNDQLRVAFRLFEVDNAF